MQKSILLMLENGEVRTVMLPEYICNAMQDAENNIPHTRTPGCLNGRLGTRTDFLVQSGWLRTHICFCPSK